MNKYILLFIILFWKPDTSFCQLSNEELRKDTLLSQVIEDSLFVELQFIEDESFLRLSGGKIDTSNRKYIKFEYEKLKDPTVITVVERLRESGMTDPEMFYLLNMRKAEVYRSIYNKYAFLKKYPTGVLSQLLILKLKDKSLKKSINK